METKLLITDIKKKIEEKEKEIREVWEKIRKEKEGPKEEIIEELKGIKRTTVDILGHDEPTILQKLFQLTGVDPVQISFRNEKIMQLFTQADTLGIPEFGTDFVKRNLLTPLKPTKFSHLVQISVDNRKAFIATEFIRKGKWDKLSESIKQEIKDKLNDKEGEIYFSILIYYPPEFYSVLLTYHATVYDIWLMTLDLETINFRLENLLSNISVYKSNEKELFSIIKVFEELNKEGKRMQKTIGKNKSFWEAWERMNIEKVLAKIYEKINNSGNKMILEMELKELSFSRGLDFNKSEIRDFKIENNTIYFPITAITGIGEKLAEKIITYRQEKGKIGSN
ncbi:12441_t:CDS:2 [Funneliformis geosporum]|uniref:12441_t:CDS:1 n=1 Tax=Funneliformis geosporum TaxID=1117311 RepID=A0A9W4WL78_9GLOM|nr:12441_t:CDS:2 [Funneliformis geosporum]